MSVGHSKDRRTTQGGGRYLSAPALLGNGQTNVDAIQPAEACDLIPSGGARDSAAHGLVIVSCSLTRAMALSFL